MHIENSSNFVVRDHYWYVLGGMHPGVSSALDLRLVYFPVNDQDQTTLPRDLPQATSPNSDDKQASTKISPYPY